MTDQLDRLKTALADRYTIEREIGSGGMATVYLVQDLKHERQVAMKVLRPELAAALGPERFLQEIKIAANLHHPHVLPLYDSGEAEGFLYYVMPYVEGESLRDRLEREKQFAIDDALQIAREVADALSYAHSHGVIHRDIKPENILLESGHAVVADFGIARAVDAAGGDRLTETGMTIGTPTYMSPEQAAGERDLDGRSDLYSLGCVLHEMLAGQPPFTGPTVESLVHQHLSVSPPSVTAIRPSVPGWVAAALERSLAKTPADRFNPVALFGEAIAPRMSATGEPVAVLQEAKSRAVWRRRGLIGAVAVIVLVLAVLIGRSTSPVPGPESPRTAIAVLPFQNLSADEENAFFAPGLHDELMTQLAKVAALKVISRTSVLGYAGTTKPLTEIADELGVGTIVEGSVQVVGNRLRVNVQLIDAGTDEHLWANRYDRTIDDAFVIQTDIAQRVVAEVGAVLGSEEQQAMAAIPTANPEAYRQYLQGRDYYRLADVQRRQRHFQIAQDFFERAVTLDSTFALAYAALSEVHGRISWHRFDTSPERLAWQRQAAERALHLAPDLPQAHLAMGLMHYLGRRDWPSALEEMNLALEGLPNDGDLWRWIGYVHRRMGHWDRVLEAFDRVSVLDPRRADGLYDLGCGALRVLRRYREAIECYDRAQTLAPDAIEPDVLRAWTWVIWQGRLDSVSTMSSRQEGASEDHYLGGLIRFQSQLLLWERRADSLLAVLGRARQGAIDAQTMYAPITLYAAWAHQLQGDSVMADAAFDSALIMLDSVVAVIPSDWRVHASRGLALAGLGRRRDALAEARWIAESAYYREDHYNGTIAAAARAKMLAQLGEADSALAEIERLLAQPSRESVHTIRLDPLYDPIRDDPRFQALLEEYDPPQPVPLN
jgi:serine/threonine-protein kinase